MTFMRMCVRIFFVLIVIGTACGGIHAQDDSAKTIRFENGRKENHYGIPFLYLEGTDYEAGRQYGYLLKDDLRRLHEEFEAFKHAMMEREIRYLPWWQRLFAPLFGGMVWNNKVESYVRQLPPEIREQIRGASESSELPVSFFNEVQVFPDLYARHCEGIVMSKQGHLYHGHNLDQPYPVSLLAQYPVVVSYHIGGEARYTNIGFVACLSLTTAFNEHGISLSENGNNHPKQFDKSNAGLYIGKNRLISRTRCLGDVDSLMRLTTFPMGLLLTLGSSAERQAIVYDLLGEEKAGTPAGGCRFIGNRTLSGALGKKSESISAGGFHEVARAAKFAELVDTAAPDMVAAMIRILGDASFYHYADPIATYTESLHNFETDQSVVFDLADSTVYFTCYPHFAAWNRWLKYNYATGEVTVYKEADPRLSDPRVSAVSALYTQLEACDWRDDAGVRALTDTVIASGIGNYLTLDFLSRTFLDRYHSPAQSAQYADMLVEKYPDVITGYFDRGRALETEGKHQEAIGEYERALRCDIRCEYFLAETYEHLALATRALGNREMASGYAAKALEIHRQYWIPDKLSERIRNLETIVNRED